MSALAPYALKRAFSGVSGATPTLSITALDIVCRPPITLCSSASTAGMAAINAAQILGGLVHPGSICVPVHSPRVTQIRRSTNMSRQDPVPIKCRARSARCLESADPRGRAGALVR
jgi:hypothetical protein